MYYVQDGQFFTPREVTNKTQAFYSESETSSEEGTYMGLS